MSALVRLTMQRIAAGQPLPQSGFGLARAAGSIARPLAGILAGRLAPGLGQMFGPNSVASAAAQNEPFGGLNLMSMISGPKLQIPFPSPGAPHVEAGLGSIFSGIAGAIGRRFGPPQAGAMAVLPAVGTAVMRTGGALVAGARRFLNTPGGKWTRRAIRDAGLVISGGLVFDLAGNLMGTVARRRMNPMNASALRRSIRRVKSARGICADIERMLPKKRSSGGVAHVVTHKRRR